MARLFPARVLASFWLRQAGVNADMLWPHPPWEQHAMFAKVLAALLGASAECAHAADATLTRGTGIQSSSQHSCANLDRYAAANTTDTGSGTTNDPNLRTHAVCDGKSESALVTASTAIRTGGKKLGHGWSISFDDLPTTDVLVVGNVRNAAETPGTAVGANHGANAPPRNPNTANSILDIIGPWTDDVPATDTAADAPVNGTAAGWRLYEDRVGKPGWISVAPGASMTVSLSHWNAEWLAFGSCLD